MRILTVGNMYPPQHLGGYELVWQGAVRALRAEGHEVDVLTTDVVFRPGAAEEDAGVARELRWHWRDHAFVKPSWRAVGRVERHDRAVLDAHLAGADVVMWWAMGGLPLSLIARARRAGVPAVGVVHDGWLVYGPRVDPVTRLLRGVPLRRLSDAGEWTFNSAAARDRTLREHRLARTSVLSPGLDLAAWPEAPEQPWAGRLLCVGRIEPAKGLAVAVDAVARLDGATLRIVGAGDARHLADLEARAAELDLGERVRFPGPVSRSALPAVYAAADAVLFPVTWEEPFGLVPLEAMAVGRPVVATATGGATEYLSDEANALVVAPGDPEALASALRRLATDGTLRARLRVGGFATARGHTADAFHRGLEAALSRAARRGRAGT